ncbi:hypothetical protein BN903_5 [Halorubrum sp. AJ67]|nr:hypothetical protein BN903_5 [Halorubrum sp. AJ67]
MSRDRRCGRGGTGPDLAGCGASPNPPGGGLPPGKRFPR